MERQDRLKEMTEHEFGLIAISYDPVEALRTFADLRGITFPLVSDEGSAIIKRLWAVE